MNVIVIVADSFRKDHLGCYGNRWIKTPNLDKLASQGTVFENAYSENMPTVPARLSMFLGRYTLPFRAWQPLEFVDDVLPERLWHTDYRKALITDTYNMHRNREVFSRGFEYVQFIRGHSNDPVGERLTDPTAPVDLSRFSEKNWKYVHSPGSRYGDNPPSEARLKAKLIQYLRNNHSWWKGEEDCFVAQVAKAGMAWLKRQVDEGRTDHLFLWLDSFDPHEPWDPPEEYSSLYEVPGYKGPPIIWGGGAVDRWDLDELRHVRAQYAGTVSLVDAWLGRFLEQVEALGLLDDTLILFTSDHGEYLGEKGIVLKVQGWPYDEIARVPFIVRPPDGMKRRDRVASFVGNPDITPTILDFLGVQRPRDLHGRSVLPLVTGEEPDGQRGFGIAGFYARSCSIRRNGWSFYTWTGPHPTKTRPELYRFDANYVPPAPRSYERDDQTETTDVIDARPDVAKDLEITMWRFLATLKPDRGDLMAHSTRSREGFVHDFRRKIGPHSE
jgi:arylsulfatase A-like enzyme